MKHSHHARRFRLEWMLLVLVLLALGASFAYDLNGDHKRIETRERERLSHQCTVVKFGMILAVIAASFWMWLVGH